MNERFIVVTLEELQEAEVRELLRTAYTNGGAVFGELRRDPQQHGAPVLRLGVLNRKAAAKLRKAIAGDAPK